MRKLLRQRFPLLALIVLAQSACSLLVSTGGLTSGGAVAPDAASWTYESSAPSTSTDASGTADTSTPVHEDASIPADSSLPADARDASATDDASDATDAEADTATPCIAVTNGLVGHWPLTKSGISGTSARDNSGHGSNGTLEGFSGTEPQSAPAPIGEALVYPEYAAAYVEIDSLALDLAAGGANTITMWFYRSSTTPAPVDDVLALLPNAPRYDLWLTTEHIDGGAYLCINTGTGDCFGIESATLFDRWVHVAAVFANGPIANGVLYVDGVQTAAACMTSAGFYACNLDAGAALPVDLGGTVDFNFHGILSDVRVYDRALTAGEVKTVYGGRACP